MLAFYKITAKQALAPNCRLIGCHFFYLAGLPIFLSQTS
jgi:hypothetical protein